MPAAKKYEDIEDVDGRGTLPKPVSIVKKKKIRSKVQITRAIPVVNSRVYKYVLTLNMKLLMCYTIALDFSKLTAILYSGFKRDINELRVNLDIKLRLLPQQKCVCQTRSGFFLVSRQVDLNS